ncbi:transferase hexapeptide repeat family protein [Paraburkholderia sacchari]|uniref:transferase hexapeptide repeat family protein n=1 Tax=Paraburkholderia sacchari TaxID=159450 RepID=UPI00054386BC|nr:transferase hexapeptide repeat family protein [Paraburkholderia sacchari]NLP64853.1 phenylacetic acid degradation protein PaaY [Paraburkholderia sacchari]
MVTVYSIDGVTPIVHPEAYVHPSAVLIGDVEIGAHCYIGPAACLRGDFGRLIVETGANIQDTCVLHGYPEIDTVVEVDGHIGHGAVLHGCRVGRNALVGMNSVVMDGAVLGESSIVAAMSLVKEGVVVPPRTLVAGMPARIVRELSDDEVSWKATGSTHYRDLAELSISTLKTTEALTEREPGRRRVTVGNAVPLHLIRAMRRSGESF